MSNRLVREKIVLAVPIALAVLTFYLTQDSGSSGAGQTSPGTFPRLVAGVLGLAALARLFMPVSQDQSPNNTQTWGWASFLRAMGAAALMAIYIYLFPIVPFLPLTIGFTFAIFVIFQIRPIWRAGLSAIAASVLLYILFLYILRIAV